MKKEGLFESQIAPLNRIEMALQGFALLHGLLLEYSS